LDTKNLKYPDKARLDKIQGRVIVTFVVDKTGLIRDIKILRSLSPECDAEVIRMMKEMPKWNPAEYDFHKVHSSFTMPINFNLR
jgi:TonB family protein